MLIHHDDILDWIEGKGKFDKKKIEEKKQELFKCPKSDKCIMDCYHKKPHIYEEKYCNNDNVCNIKCVHELISDCTFFEEDFLV